MGYAGLKCGLDSDNVADLQTEIIASIVKHLKKAVKLRDNEYNTDGGVNVAFIFDEMINPSFKKFGAWGYDKELIEIAIKTVEKLDQDIKDAKNIENWEDNSNRLDHLYHYKRLRRSVMHFINECKS